MKSASILLIPSQELLGDKDLCFPCPLNFCSSFICFDFSTFTQLSLIFYLNKKECLSFLPSTIYIYRAGHFESRSHPVQMIMCERARESVFSSGHHGNLGGWRPRLGTGNRHDRPRAGALGADCAISVNIRVNTQEGTRERRYTTKCMVTTFR